MIRKANQSDTDQIHNLIQPYVEANILLPRSKKLVQDEIQLTWVFEEDSQVKACANLTVFGENLYEIRALAVAPDSQKRGVGKNLILAVEEHIKDHFPLPVHLFALTYDPDFFIKIGFQITQKEKFPQKVYDVCQYCAKKDDCKETAVEKVVLP